MSARMETAGILFKKWQEQSGGPGRAAPINTGLYCVVEMNCSGRHSCLCTAPLSRSLAAHCWQIGDAIYLCGCVKKWTMKGSTNLCLEASCGPLVSALMNVCPTC